jgi:hypothetical protein
MRERSTVKRRCIDVRREPLRDELAKAAREPRKR